MNAVELSSLSVICINPAPAAPLKCAAVLEDVLLTSKAFPLKVKFASPFKLTPLPPVITRLSALFDIVACAVVVLT